MAESHLLTTKHPDVNMTPDFSHIKTKAFGLNRLIESRPSALYNYISSGQTNKNKQ